MAVGAYNLYSVQASYQSAYEKYSPYNNGLYPGAYNMNYYAGRAYYTSTSYGSPSYFPSPGNPISLNNFYGTSEANEWAPLPGGNSNCNCAIP